MKRKTRSPIATPAVKILTISLRCLKHRMVKNAKFSRKIWKKISKKESSTPLGNIMGAWPGMNLFKGNKAKSIEAKFVQQTSLKAVANHGGSRVCRMSGKSNSSSSRSNGGQNHLVLEVRNSSWTSQNWLSKKIPIEKRCVCVCCWEARGNISMPLGLFMPVYAIVQARFFSAGRHWMEKAGLASAVCSSGAAGSQGCARHFSTQTAFFRGPRTELL